MKYKAGSFFRRFFPILLLTGLFLRGADLSAGTTAVYYDGVEGGSEAYKSACYISRLLFHFDIREIDILPVRDYTPGSLDAREMVFLFFEEGSPTAPAALLDDLSRSEAVIVWIHSHIDGLLERAPDKWGFHFLRGEERGDWIIRYKNREFTKEDPWLNIVTLDESRTATVRAWISDGEDLRFPYVLHSRNLWYFADSPFSYSVEGGRFLILADLLHEICGVDHPVEHLALVRIEDINPESDPAALRKISDYLHRRRVPFQISLIPVYKNPGSEIEVPISERPALIEALRYACSRGATLVLHGLTHQHRGETGDDYEFWDDIAGRPIPHESADWVDLRVRRGIEMCTRNRLYPLAWETPHYSGSRQDYRTIAGYFSAFYDRVMAAELSGTQQIFPYPVRMSDPDIQVIPENLGYLPLEDPDPAVLLESAERMLAVRDGMASFFFHPFVPLDNLKRVIEGMRDMGWRFVSIRGFECRVRTESLWAGTYDDQVEIRLENQYLHERLVDAGGRVLRDVYGARRETGVLSRRLEVPPGGYGVLEALDLLPEETPSDRPPGLAARLGRLLKREKTKPALNLTRVIVLMESDVGIEGDNDQRSFVSALRFYGLHPMERPRSSLTDIHLDAGDLLVAPNPSARRLSRRESNTVIDFVEKGGRLITDGRSPLAEALGLHFEESARPVRAVKELSLPAPDLIWNPPVELVPFSSSSELILARDATGESALATIHRFRKGRVLFFGTLFDPHTPWGIARYPYFPHYLKNSLGIAFNARRNSLEFYFDPGFHQNTSWEKLVKRWQASGINIVYLAAWHFYRNYEFDYAYFIRLCHEFGIAVYAWFELPQVTPLFWEDHPEWREKTAVGRDARPHWRSPMNLLHPRAREAALSWMEEKISEFDWDGINLAELNFDTNQGRLDPAQFTPMNDDVRRMFSERAGFDPVLFFDPGSPHHWRKDETAFDAFLRFRADIIRDLHAEALARVDRAILRKGKSMEVIVTAMDSLFHPEIYEDCGIDTRDIIDLMDAFSFTLQVEDPARSWASAPDRYRVYSETYRELIPDPGRLMFDVNLISMRDINGRRLPSPLAIGTELAATVYFAAQGGGRVGLYSEATIHPLDMDLLPYVMSADVRIRAKDGGYHVEAEAPFILSGVDLRDTPFINDRKWPFTGMAGISIPSGINRLEFRDRGRSRRSPLTPRILLDADILDLRVSGRAYSLRYSSPVPASLVFSRQPLVIRIDGQDLDLSRSALGTILPRGEHDLEIITGSVPLEVIEEAGYISSSLFYLLGLASVLSLAAVYIYARVKR